jgi:hypothetical protein
MAAGNEKKESSRSSINKKLTDLSKQPNQSKMLKISRGNINQLLFAHSDKKSSQKQGLLRSQFHSPNLDSLT